MWNYRVVRKNTIYQDSSGKKDRITYTYAIPEAYYDKNGFAGAITEDPIEPFEETIEELRHSWVMMAEAFGKPILDYGMIPEPGYNLEDDPMASELDKRIKDFESDKTKTIPWELILSGWLLSSLAGVGTLPVIGGLPVSFWMGRSVS
ncbi:MAG: hypothetical protein ABR534_12845 [Desulfotignum sp.]|nr:hypothetical protein [Desulfobacteraceae bacterium]